MTGTDYPTHFHPCRFLSDNFFSDNGDDRDLQNNSNKFYEAGSELGRHARI
jgi:hypothetical protein